MKILFLTPHPEEGASSRVRVYQFVPYLETMGHVCYVRPFLSSEAYARRLFRLSSNAENSRWLIGGLLRRFRDLLLATQCDVVFIHREALPYGPPILEWLLSLLGCKIALDFDDALFLTHSKDARRGFHHWMKNPSRFRATLKLATHAVAGNSFLADYAREYCREVSVIPSVIDSRRYIAKPMLKPDQPLVIGWMGSPSTVGNLFLVKSAMSRLFDRYKVQLSVIGATIPIAWGLQAECRRFRFATEIQDLQSFDIGIMPLTDDEWTKGKCAFKALQYMGVGIPVVSSPVGAVQEIIRDGQNGMLAGTEDDWFRKLEILITNPGLRHQIGCRGREYVVKNYSIEAALPRLLFVLDRIASESAAVRRTQDAAPLNTARITSTNRESKR